MQVDCYGGHGAYKHKARHDSAHQNGHDCVQVALCQVVHDLVQFAVKPVNILQLLTYNLLMDLWNFYPKVS